MKQVVSFIKKEFYHIFRDSRSLLLLLIMPVALMVIFGFAITNEIRNNNLAVFDMAKDGASQKMISRFNASRYFDVMYNVNDASELERVFQKNIASLIIVIPANFNSTLIANNKAQIQILADGSDPNTATSLTNYASSIISDYQHDLMKQANTPYQVTPLIKMMYNPELKGAYTFVPGVMGLILLLISTMMTSVSIVREKELGTMEVLLVSPLPPLLIVLTKAIPYLLISIINVLTILGLSIFVLNLPVQGSFILLLLESILFIITCLALGLLISTASKTQQVAMLISLLGLMLPTMLLSGFIFPVENMPAALQYVSKIVPATWFIIIVKSVMLKGLGFASVWKETLVLLSMALFFIIVSVKRFKIRLQ
ncbi:MAG TPA: ABC transporter permease [Chitinophagaceae bacterium]|nr:ABC transporter permease [Chitinophagaceae bacterium]